MEGSELAYKIKSSQFSLLLPHQAEVTKKNNVEIYWT